MSGAAIDAVGLTMVERLGAAVTCGAPAGEFVTYRTGGPLRVLVRAHTMHDLLEVATVLRESPPVKVAVIGRGSNLLVSDAGFDGVVVMLGTAFDAIDVDVSVDGAGSSEGVVVPEMPVADRGVRVGQVGSSTVRAGGAVALPVLARRAAGAGLAGLEFYVGIPGSVGGAVRMNAGGHGCDTASVLRRAFVVNLRRSSHDGSFVTQYSAGELALGYRESRLTEYDVVVGAEFAVSADDPERCGARLDEIVRWRREHQPGGSNAGSIFRNPPGDAAGRLIDVAGCKGLRIGGAVVSDKHANFIQAQPGTSAADISALIDEVARRVVEATGVSLVTEVCRLGFDAVDAVDAVEQPSGGQV